MFRALILGILLGILLVWPGSVFLFFDGQRAGGGYGRRPCPSNENWRTWALDAYLKKLPHSEPQVPADEPNFLAGAEVYKQNCAVCHGLPGEPKTKIAEGMAPDPPQLFHGTGVTDDEAVGNVLESGKRHSHDGHAGIQGQV